MQAVSTQPTRDLAATGNNNPHVPIQRSQSPSPFFGDCGEMPRVLASWLVPGGSTALVRRAGVTDSSGESGEVIITGRARFLEDPELRTLAVRICPYKPAERYILFEFDPETVMLTEYPDGKPIRKRWQVDEEKE